MRSARRATRRGAVSRVSDDGVEERLPLLWVLAERDDLLALVDDEDGAIARRGQGSQGVERVGPRHDHDDALAVALQPRRDPGAHQR